MIRKYTVIFILLFISLFIFADETGDNTDDSWVNNYINLDPSDDLYNGFKLKNYKISKEYVENLIWNQEIKFYVPEFDEFNLRKNINILPRFPFVIMPYGVYSYNRGFNFGLLVRADNFLNSRVALSFASSFEQNRRFWFHTNVEYPALLQNRLKLLGTLSFFTSAPQYSSRVAKFKTIGNTNIIMSFANKIWDKFGVTFNKFSDIGFYAVYGADYRIPFIELNWVTTAEFMYNYVHLKEDTIVDGLIKNYELLPVQKLINKNNFFINIGQEFKWNKLKQTATIPVGNLLSLTTKFYLPTSVGYADKFRFKARIEDSFTKKIFREFAFKLRFLIEANYNISEDFSGDPYIRGYADQELTGWFALLANLEAYIPIVDVDIIQGPNMVPFKNPAKFVIYLVLFADGGFTIENYDNYLNGFNERIGRKHIANSLLITGDPFGQKNIGYNNYLLPAVSVGGGIQFYPYFLHFVLRADVGVNLLKAIIYNKPLESIEVSISFSQMF